MSGGVCFLLQATNCALAPGNNMLHDSGMSSPHEIIRAVGAERAATALDVGPASVRVQLSRGVLPASWFDILEALCVEAGIPCPRSAFNFKKPSIAKTHGDSTTSVQDNVTERAGG